MTAERVRLHIENSRRKPDIFHITPERWDAACARHRALAERLQVSIGWDGDILDEALKSAQIVIGVPARREQLRERAPGLRWIHSTSAGIDSLLPLDWLPSGVIFTNNRGAHGVKAEEFMHMAFTLLHTRMPEVIANQNKRRWVQIFSPSIAGKTALIIGLGDLGQGAARAARALRLKVIGVRRSSKKCRFADEVHPFTELDSLLPRADFVVLAIPLTAETRNLLNRGRLMRLKRGAGVINIARAPVADYEALAERLHAGELAGAILDVVDPEPLPPDSYLWATPNLIITPHISCDDGEHYIDISLDLWFENLGRFLESKRLLQRVDPRRGY